MLVRWDEKYRVGVERIDQEHQYLFRLINEFYDAFMEKRDRSVLVTLLNRLVDYSESHFKYEESLMREAGYGGAAEHCAHHERLFEQIFVLAGRFEDRSFNPTHEATVFLRSWLADHILQEDLPLGLHLRVTSRPAA